MVDNIAADLAKETAGKLIAGVIQQIKDVVELDTKLRLLKTNFSYMELLLRQIDQPFQEQQKRLPEAIAECLTQMSNHLKEGRQLIDSANRQRRCCFGCCLLCNPNLFTQITDWKTRFGELFQGLQGVVSIFANIQPIVSAAPPQAELRQPVPDSGFVGSTIESAQKRLQEWVTQPHPQARMIGVHGMGGVGKTSLLKLVYNSFKEVSSGFDVVIWAVVSQDYQIEKLRSSIAETLKLKTEGISDTDNLKMTLSASLVKKRFLLILDDIWCPIDLDEVGVKFGDQHSKVLMSSRRKDVIAAMGASDDYTLRIQPLSTEDGWKLFKTTAFINGAVPRENIEAIARVIASECRGLPLALKTVAAAMRPKKTEEEWARALTLMRNVDPSFLTSHNRIDAELYKRLKFSYDDLDPKLKISFLYCAVFPEDAQINVDTLLEVWSAEKLVTGMDAGNECIDALVSRGLFEYIAADALQSEWIKLRNGCSAYQYPKKAVKVHDILRDLAIDIGRREEDKWLFGTGQRLHSFPSEDETRDCKRISVGHNDIQDLPTDPICSQLVSLVLANNENIREVPEGFLSTAMSLKVLDLSGTLISSLPTSLGQLRRLELLNLTGCYLLEELPENTGNLSSLRFLNLQYCQSLNSLPDRIGGLRNLKHLNLQGCESLNSLPDGIGDLRNLEHLNLKSCESLNSLPDSIGGLRNLEHLNLKGCESLNSLPDGIGDLRNLERLNLKGCDSLMGIPEGIFSHLTSLKKLRLALHIRDCAMRVKDLANLSNLMELSAQVKPERKEGTKTTWTEMRRLCLRIDGDDRDDVVEDILPLQMENMNKLESFYLGGFQGVSLPDCISQIQNLRDLELSRCRQLRALPACEIRNEIAGAGFPMLKKLQIEYLDEFEALEIGTGGLPMLEVLSIRDCKSFKRLGTKKLPALKKLEIEFLGEFEALEIGTGGLPMLKVLSIRYCMSFKRLGTKKLPALKELRIECCHDFEAMEFGPGGLPMLEALSLGWLNKFEITVGPTGVINDGVMPKLLWLQINDCPLLKTVENLSNLRILFILHCCGWRQLEIGRGGFPMLERLFLKDCEDLESMVGPSDVWNEETMPKLQEVKIRCCPLLRRLPRGMEKLSNLKEIEGELEWWQNIIWDDDNVKMNLSPLFKISSRNSRMLCNI